MATRNVFKLIWVLTAKAFINGELVNTEITDKKISNKAAALFQIFYDLLFNCFTKRTKLFFPRKLKTHIKKKLSIITLTVCFLQFYPNSAIFTIAYFISVFYKYIQIK